MDGMDEVNEVDERPVTGGGANGAVTAGGAAR